jgi:hypothetical protein
MTTEHDRRILRDLARRVAEIAALPAMEERRREWKRHNALRPGRPMLLVFPEGSWSELLPAECLKCEEETARRWEWELRHRIYTYEHFATDNVVEGEWIVSKAVWNSGWGLEARHHDSPVSRGAWRFDPVITEPDDLKKLRFPEVVYDEKATEQAYAEAHELFGDILTVRLKGVAHVSFHLMNHYTGLRGLEQVMMDMCERPEMVHEAMSLLEEGNRGLIRQYQEMNLLSLNNDNTYHSSGGVGYTDELPQPDCDPQHIRPCDMWASAETQEFDEVSPRMHREFALQYERRLLEPFGLNGYGCCDDLTSKMEDVLSIPRMRRVSIAPFANVERAARALGNRAIFSWKPDPTYLTSDIDQERLRAYLRHTLDVTQGCTVEMILKDTHTCGGRPERFDQWTQAARAVVGS